MSQDSESSKATWDKEQQRMQITSNFTSNADVFYERIEDKKTGEVDVMESNQPSTVSSKTTVTTRPYKFESDILPKSDTNNDPASQLAAKKPKYDTSEL
jgi:hypothetical protein